MGFSLPPLACTTVTGLCGLAGSVLTLEMGVVSLRSWKGPAVEVGCGGTVSLTALLMGSWGPSMVRLKKAIRSPL